MTKREKIIVGMMVAAVLYGAYSFLFSGSTDNKKKLPVRSEVPVIEFVADLIKQIQKADTTATGRLIIERSASKWVKDPFLVVKKTEANEGETERPQAVISGEGLAGAFHYSGYMEMGKSKLAIINGMEYQQGDTLGTSGAVLRKISPGEVRIFGGGGQGVIVVPLDDASRL